MQQSDLVYLLEPMIQAGNAVVTFLHKVKPVMQNREPMCGLVAITMAGELLSGAVASSASPENLLSLGRQRQVTKHGELLSANFLLQIASEAIRCCGKIVPYSVITHVNLLEHLLCGHAIVVPYDCDKDHTPCLAKGHRAHWCLIVGVAFPVQLENPDFRHLLPHCTQDPSIENHYILQDDHVLQSIAAVETLSDCRNPHVFTRHGKSRHLGLWKLSDLLKSNVNITEFSTQHCGDDYVLPDEELSECLGSKIVILSRTIV